jgi:polysaccharide export outer membrane protein
VKKIELVRISFGFLFCAYAVGIAGGQLPSQDAVDCSDLRFSALAACQTAQSPMAQSGRPYSSNPPTQTAPQVDSAGRDVYVDSAGFPQNTTNQNSTNQQQTAQRRGRQEPLTDLQRLTQQATGELLPIFGHDLFRMAPSTFAPADQIPASPDYILGPGDEVILRIWGHTNENLRLTVDRSGSIYVPHLGGVDVAGLRFGDLERHLKQELNRTYKNFDLSVNLGKLRSIQVFVLGEAYSPGSYTVSSLSTAFNALLTSGGPTPEGSLRKIELRRGSATIATLDLYDFLLRGDRSRDIVLQSGDVIFIPFVGGQVAISGSVRHPAIYEIQPDSTIGELLKEAGGPNSTASQSRVAIERIEDHHIRQAMSVQLDQAGLGTKVAPGDVLHVDPVLIGYKDSVTIRGNLANAGRFPWRPGMKLSDVIPDRESLLTSDYWRERNKLGLPTPLFEPGTDRLDGLTDHRLGGRGQDLRDLRQPAANSIAEDSTLSSLPGQTLSGDDAAVAYPATADGVVNGQLYDRGRMISRPGVQIQDADTENARNSLADQQAVSSRNLMPQGRTIDIKVAVPEIDWSYAVIQRLDPNTLRNSLVPFDLGKLVQNHDSTQDLPLQPGDIVTILSQKDIHVRQDAQTKYVRLEGEFVRSGVYSVEPGQTLAEVVSMAGGLTGRAYLYGSSFTRESARVLQQQRLNEYVSTLSVNMGRASAERSLSATGPQAALSTSTEQSALLDQIRKMRATGRVVLEFKPTSLDSSSIPSIPLEDGDTFRVPARPIIVSVVGAVYGQNVFLYNANNRVRDYLLLAGKTNRIADRKHAFIIRADGSVYAHDQRGGPWGENFGALAVNPGDTIVVPEKPIKPSALREVLDYSQLFSQFAIGAAALNVIR